MSLRNETKDCVSCPLCERVVELSEDVEVKSPRDGPPDAPGALWWCAGIPEWWACKSDGKDGHTDSPRKGASPAEYKLCGCDSDCVYV